MAYLEKKKDGSSDTQGANSNPYDAIAAPTGYASESLADNNPTRQGPAAPGTLDGGNTGPSTTGHVNFDQIYNANAGVAEREAGNRQSAIDSKAKAAQTELTGAQGKFNSAVTGATTNVPTQSQKDWAAYSPSGVTPGKKVVAARYSSTGQTGITNPNDQTQKVWNSAIPDQVGVGPFQVNLGAVRPHGDAGAVHSDQSYVTENQEGLQSSDDGSDPRAPLPGVTPTPGYDTSHSAADEAAVRAGATAKYAGPDSLSSDTDAYQKLLDDTTAAQDFAENPLVGLNQTDAALLGAAGRSGFEQRKAQYGGLEKSLSDANDASVQQANSARNITKGASEMYDDLLNRHDGRVGADRSAEDASQAASDKRIADAQTHAQNVGAYDAANKEASTGLNGARNYLHGLATAASPVDLALQASGNRTIVDRGTDMYGGLAGDKPGQDNAGHRSPAWGPDDADVYAAMTPADWDEFNGLSLDQQKAWIAAHKGKGT